MANPNIKRAVRVALVAASAGSAAMYGAATVAQEAELEQVDRDRFAHSATQPRRHQPGIADQLRRKWRCRACSRSRTC